MEAIATAVERGREMKDLIYRQDAIDAIDVKNVNKGIISALQSIIEELPPAQQWTPVSEGLPKLKDGHYVSGWVLCSDNEERICFGRVEETVFGQMLWNCERDGVSGKVLAWMPLPEPYKGDVEK